MAERRRRARAKGQAPHIVTEPTREGSPCWKAEAERSTEAIIIISISGSGDTDSQINVLLLWSTCTTHCASTAHARTASSAMAVLPDGLRFVKCVGRTARIVYHGLAPVEDAAPYAVDLSRIQAPLPTTAAESGSEDGPASLATTKEDRVP